jgi:hypothetical protein
LRAWPIDARAAGIRCLSLFIGFSGPASSKSVTVLAFLRSEEVLAEKIGLHGAQAMVTIEKINLNWPIRPGRAPTQPRMVLVDHTGA